MSEHSSGSTSMRGQSREGMALPVALLGIVVIAIMVSGAFFASTQAFRAGRNSLVEQRSFTVAEYGLNSEIANWDRARNLAPGAGGKYLIGDTVATRVYVANGDTAWVRITRLTDNTFWVMSDGRASIGSNSLESRRRTNAFVRIAYPSIKPKGAITAAGDITIHGNARIDGHNTNPPGWDCVDPPGANAPPIVASPSAKVDMNKPGNVIQVDPDPKILRDPAAADSNTYVRYGTETWKSLVAAADITLPGGWTGQGAKIEPSLTSGLCSNTLLNWGEPLRNAGSVAKCYGRYPIIYAPGDLHLNANGRGQGILLVNGSLDINGNFDFYGMIIVRNDINKGNGNATVHGAIYAANTVLGDGGSMWSGNQDVLYSQCAVESALRGSAILTRVKERGWSQVF